MPLPIGNGEQRLNALPVVEAGGGLLVDDADLDADWIAGTCVPLLTDAGRLAADGRRPPRLGRRDADERLVDIVLAAAGDERRDVAAWTDPVPTLDELGRVHFVGIGGAGMCGIARILLARGMPGLRQRRGLPRRSRRCGRSAPRFHVGHDAAHVGDADTVVVSTAIRQNNPELADARERGLRVLPRAEALAAVMAGRRGVAVAGTHGKTTTTSMLTVALQHCGLDPSFAIGGHLDESGSNAHHGSGDVFVAEADESDGSFLLYAPPPRRHERRGRPSRPLRRPRGGRGGLRPASSTASTGGFLVTCADDPGAAAAGRRPRAGATSAPTARPRTPTCGSTDLESRATAPASSASLDGHGARPGAGSGARAAHGAQQRRGAARRPELGLPADDSSRAWPASPACAGGSSSRAPRPACGSTTTTPTTRPRSTAQLRAAREVAGGGRLVAAFQPHLLQPDPDFAEEFGGRSAWPTRSSSWTSTAPARTRCPA